MSLIVTRRRDGWYLKHIRLNFDRKEAKTVWAWRKP